MLLSISSTNYKNHKEAKLCFFAREHGRLNQDFISKINSPKPTVSLVALIGNKERDISDLTDLVDVVSTYTTSTKNESFKLNGTNKTKPTSISAYFLFDSKTYKYTLIVENNIIQEESIELVLVAPSNATENPTIISRKKLDDGNYKVLFKATALFSDDTVFTEFLSQNDQRSIISIYAPKCTEANSIYNFMSNRVTAYDKGITPEHQFELACIRYESDSAIFSQLQSTMRQFDLLPDNARIVINRKSDISTISVIYDINSKQIELSYEEQSSGFKQLFCMLANIIPILKNGGLCVINHIDRNLHPILAKAVINLFKSELCHKEAQCIATFNTTFLLKHLDHDQVILVDTNRSSLSTEKATNRHLRKDADLEHALVNNLLFDYVY